jgi:hypothetical protein
MACACHFRDFSKGWARLPKNIAPAENRKNTMYRKPQSGVYGLRGACEDRAVPQDYRDFTQLSYRLA